MEFFFGRALLITLVVVVVVILMVLVMVMVMVMIVLVVVVVVVVVTLNFFFIIDGIPDGYCLQQLRLVDDTCSASRVTQPI